MLEGAVNKWFNNEDRLRQPISYEGLNLTNGRIPTDIDGFLDYNGDMFVFIEGKTQGTEMSKAQRLAFSNNNTSYKDYILAFTIVFHHNVPALEIVIAKDQMVTEFFSSITKKWRKPKKPMTVLEILQEFENKLKRHKKDLKNKTNGN